MEELYEVEVKLPITSMESIEETILQAGGVRLNSETQSDIYFDHPCRSFSVTDESIRLRHRTPLGDSSLSDSGFAPIELTYKGPKIDKKTKTRIEYTADLGSIEPIIAILKHTGFKRVATITKRRVFFDIDGITASIDDVDDVGLYIELELIADGKDSMNAARERILSLLKTMGLDENDLVRESYLELYLERASL